MPSATDLNSLDEAVEAYISVLSSLLDKHAPSTTTKSREGKNAWWTSKCQDARRVHRAAGHKYKRDKAAKLPGWEASHLKYKEVQVNAAIVINREMNNYYTNKLSTIAGNPKATYKVVNKLLDKEYGKKPNFLTSKW